KWGIKAIVDTSGLDPMLLRIPGKTFLDKRRALVRAYWTTTVLMAQTPMGDPNVEHLAVLAEMGALQEAVVDVKHEKKARAQFVEEREDYYKDLRAMRYSARQLGLDEDEVYAL